MIKTDNLDEYVSIKVLINYCQKIEYGRREIDLPVMLENNNGKKTPDR